jgi:hypothetical protein
MNSRYSSAYIDIDCGMSRSKLSFWTKPKVVIAGMTKVIEAVFVDQPYAMGVGIYGIQCESNRQAQVVAAILNSRFISFYFTKMFRDKMLAGGYLAINKNTIEEIPYIAPADDLMDEICELSAKIHSAKKVDPKADTSPMERLVDQLVNSIFGLGPDEIAEIDNWSAGE